MCACVWLVRSFFSLRALLAFLASYFAFLRHLSISAPPFVFCVYYFSFNFPLTAVLSFFTLPFRFLNISGVVSWTPFFLLFFFSSWIGGSSALPPYLFLWCFFATIVAFCSFFVRVRLIHPLLSRFSFPLLQSVRFYHYLSAKHPLAPLFVCHSLSPHPPCLSFPPSSPFSLLCVRIWVLSLVCSFFSVFQVKSQLCLFHLFFVLLIHPRTEQGKQKPLKKRSAKSQHQKKGKRERNGKGESVLLFFPFSPEQHEEGLPHFVSSFLGGDFNLPH